MNLEPFVAKSIIGTQHSLVSIVKHFRKDYNKYQLGKYNSGITNSCSAMINSIVIRSNKMVTDTNYLIKRIEMLQEELDSLKKTILSKTSERKVSLKGLWNGINIPETEIDRVKTSWFKEC